MHTYNVSEFPPGKLIPTIIEFLIIINLEDPSEVQ